MKTLCALVLLLPSIMAAQNERVIVKLTAPAALQSTFEKPLIDELKTVKGIEITTDELNNEIEIVLDVQVLSDGKGNDLYALMVLVRSREVGSQVSARLMTNGGSKKIPGGLIAARDIFWVPIIQHEVVRPSEWAATMKQLVKEVARVVPYAPAARQAVR